MSYSASYPIISEHIVAQGIVTSSRNCLQSFYIQIVLVEYCFISLTNYTDVFAETAAVRHKGVWHSICHKSGEVFWKISLKIKKRKTYYYFPNRWDFENSLTAAFRDKYWTPLYDHLLYSATFICLDELRIHLHWRKACWIGHRVKAVKRHILRSQRMYFLKFIYTVYGGNHFPRDEIRFECQYLKLKDHINEDQSFPKIFLVKETNKIIHIGGHVSLIARACKLWFSIAPRVTLYSYPRTRTYQL